VGVFARHAVKPELLAHQRSMTSPRKGEIMRRICTIAAFAATFAVFVPACAFAAGWSHMIPFISEANGFIASTLVLATFTMKDMRMLRIVAIFSNVAFITYAALDWLPPVLILHLMLLH
jgi:hypothetical protein